MNYLNKHSDPAILLLSAKSYINSFGVKQYIKSKFWTVLYSVRAKIYRVTARLNLKCVNLTD